MRGLYTLFIVTLLALTNLSAQTLSRYTTGELLHRLKANTTGSYSNAEDPFNYALPLIDSVVALECAKLSGFDIEDNYVYAIGLQCHDDSLKQLVLNNLLCTR